MTFVTIEGAKDLPDGTMTGVETGDRQILVVNLGGTLYSIGNKCTHAGCKLTAGSIDGETVRCKCHGSVFNLKSGEVVHGPARKPEPVFKVWKENGEVRVEI